jgi:alpha-L-glutamate ligase-like protein
MIVSPFSLKARNVLGMNARNIEYISRQNDRRLYPLVDNKLETKRLVEKHGLKAPELFGHIEFHGQIKKLSHILPQTGGFVLKPAQGSGGKGILVITEQRDNMYVKSNGVVLSYSDLKRHVSNILSGLYSLGGKDDVALVEKQIHFDDYFEPYSFEGIPDIRVIVYKGYPVMAMIRLSTSSSDGKANLHQGAVGVGLDIAKGTAIAAVQDDRPVMKHPDTQADLMALRIPHWKEILRLASESYDMTNLGYLGADIVIDKEAGPMLLELNARPGLAIQIANNAGLQERLNTIDTIALEHQNSSERIAFIETHFGAGHV